jgi:hypothetical protein
MSTQIQITPASGITVGTTPIKSGTDGRVLFQNGGVVQQDAGFLFSATTKMLESRGKGNATVTVLGNNAGGDILAYGYTGTNNVHVGSYAGAYLSSGSQNTFVGAASGTSIRTGGKNTFIGYNGYSYPVGLSNNVVITDGSSYTAFWKDANNFCGIGYASQSDTLGAKLDIKAQGALSTDIALRVRNSANTANIFEVRGNAIVYVDPTAAFQANGFTIQSSSFNRVEHTVGLIWSGTSATIGLGCSSTQDMRTGSIGGAPIYGIINWHDQNIQLGSTAAVNGRGVFSIGTNTAPTTNMLDGFRLYSADIVAGNAAPHFRTENGNIIKLYQQSSAGILTVPQLVTVLQNLGLLS